MFTWKRRNKYLETIKKFMTSINVSLNKAYASFSHSFFFFFGLLQCYNSNYASFQMVEIIWNYFSALEGISNSAEIK